MKKWKSIIVLFYLFSSLHLFAQTFHDSLFVEIPGGTFVMGETESSYKGPPGSYNAYPHNVTLSFFQMSKTEITNEQYVAFLNSAQATGLVEVYVEIAPGPDLGFTLVYGTEISPTEYKGKAIVNLSGTRVMKDHDNADGDNDPFTGDIEPENPLNISYIGYLATKPVGERFYMKDPRNPSDFNWNELTNYYNYTSITRQLDKTVLLNDYEKWEELENYPANLPTLQQVKNWPATFIRWYGAKAFALFYNLDLPSEAQWEYAALGGAGFVYATANGLVNGDGTSANWNYKGEHPCTFHVEEVRINQPNPYGLYNMAGNVWEWMDDWYEADYYNNSADATNPVNTTTSAYKVRRGGSWNYHLSTLKSAARAYDEQFKGNDHFGFRVVKNGVETLRQKKPNTIGSYQLFQNYPNPFNPTTTIVFVLTKPGNIKITVSDILGRTIRTLVNSIYTTGQFQTVWDGTDDRGTAVSAGIYFYEMRTNDYRKILKMVYAK